MLCLLSFTVYGVWFDAPGRGWIERCGLEIDSAIPEPDEMLSTKRGSSLKWPDVRLGQTLRQVIIDDLPRIATLRSFDLESIVVAPDHVHVLLRCADDRDVPRLVQLVKGALSRALSVATGDAPPRDRHGGSAPHQRWWSSQYSFRRVEDRDNVERMLCECLSRAHRSTWPM